MSRRPTALLLLAAALACVAPASARSTPGCGAGETTTASGAVRVFQVERRATLDYYACWKRTRRVSFLGGDDIDFVLSGFTVAGRYVAFVKTEQDRYGDQSSFVVVRSAASGRTLRRSPLVDGATTALVLSRRGYVAWVRSDRAAVHVEDFAGPDVRLIDSGADVDPKSLALGGSYLYWTKGGQPRSARVG